MDDGKIGQSGVKGFVFGTLKRAIIRKGERVGCEDGTALDQLFQGSESHFVDFVGVHLLQERVDFLDDDAGELVVFVVGQVEAGNDVENVGDDADSLPHLLVLFVDVEETLEELGKEVQVLVLALGDLAQSAHGPAEGVDFSNAQRDFHGTFLDFVKENFLDLLQNESREVLENQAHLVIELGAFGDHGVLLGNPVVINHH